MKHHLISAVLVGSLFFSTSTLAKEAKRDQFFWLGDINKATAVINSQEGLLDTAMMPTIAGGIKQVIEDGSKPGAGRPSTVITFEPLLIKAAGSEVTLLHAGRSSQDMHATYNAAILREDLLSLADQLNRTARTLVGVAENIPARSYRTIRTASQPSRTASATICWATQPGSTAMPSAFVRAMRAWTARPWEPPFSTAPAGR